MPLFESFTHYLAYGATDQETFRELRGSYNGVLVPGTIAAWQRQGTGGFVLALSATPEAPPYVIDPRFPLFQQRLANPKASHYALADLFGDPDLIETRDPSPDAFPDARLRFLAENWARFNTEYGLTSSEKFDKYADRLGEPIVAPEQAQGPEAVLAPYFVSGGVNDPWWDRSLRLFEHTRAASTDRPCLRVVCALNARALNELLDGVDEPEQIAVWVSGLDEHRAPPGELAAYRTALANAERRRQPTFALYGGFFSVLLAAVGLHGSAHGIGFSEHRNWLELPESGAPPPRYYLLEIHRYVSQDLAQQLRETTENLARCDCPYCRGREPVELEYHDLMKHSVWCRAEEITSWVGRDPETAAIDLRTEHEAVTTAMRAANLAPAIKTRAIGAAEPLQTWADALSG
jgi:hypothetical protein